MPAPADTVRPDPRKPFVDVAELCQRYGVKARTVYTWVQRSRPGGIYEHRPFPAAYNADEVGRGVAPYWLPRQLAALDRWRAGMVGQGAGGGRPRKGSGGAG
ncbi:hypothetical protein ABT336_11775 [Micromonospora sp. NPDC000207]|uniref:hypothetical protein n=1 Tax=Micromonospora sp. NPDC000207 TaxID=3154246 RepID=UPI003325EECD